MSNSNSANNNLAGATWEKSLATQMEAITKMYASKIGAEQNRLNRLEKEKVGL